MQESQHDWNEYEHWRDHAWNWSSPVNKIPRRPHCANFFTRHISKTRRDLNDIWHDISTTSKFAIELQSLHKAHPWETQSDYACSCHNEEPWRSHSTAISWHWVARHKRTRHDGSTNCSDLQLQNRDLDAKAEKRRFWSVFRRKYWKLNFRQYGEMKTHASSAEAQRWRKSQERRCRCAKR